MFPLAFPVKAVAIKCLDVFPYSEPSKVANAFFNQKTQKWYVKLLWLRGFHYWIVSQPIANRQIPSNKGTRTYENTKNDYKRLSRLVKFARMKGLIPDDLMFDNRNDPIIQPLERRFFKLLRESFHAYAGYSLTMEMDEIKDFDDFVSYVDIQLNFRKNRFHNQFYEIIVVTEKLTVKAVIEDICMDSGANCLIVKGQSSFTRIIEICKKAKITNRPVLLLGIFDLDCAGWDMPTAFMKSVNDFYPHPHHKFERVALLRSQAEEYELATAFDYDEKKYKDAVKKRFLVETGSSDCIELDAMDNNIMRDLLKERLIYYSGNTVDKIQQRRKEKKYYNKVRQILTNLDLEKHRAKYDEIQEEYSDLYERFIESSNDLNSDYNSLSDRFLAIENEIEELLKKSFKRSLECYHKWRYYGFWHPDIIIHQCSKCKRFFDKEKGLWNEKEVKNLIWIYNFFYLQKKPGEVEKVSDGHQTLFGL